jgi:hypothetical protein
MEVGELEADAAGVTGRDQLAVDPFDLAGVVRPVGIVVNVHRRLLSSHVRDEPQLPDLVYCRRVSLPASSRVDVTVNPLGSFLDVMSPSAS